MTLAEQLGASLKSSTDPFKEAMTAFMPAIAEADAAIQAITENRARLQCNVVDRQADKTILCLLLEVGGVQSQVEGEEHRYDNAHHTLLATFAVCVSAPTIRRALTPAGSDPFEGWTEVKDLTAAKAILQAMAADKDGPLVTTLAKLLRS